MVNPFELKAPLSTSAERKKPPARELSRYLLQQPPALRSRSAKMLLSSQIAVELFECLWLFKETDENKKVSYQFWQPDNHPELCYQLDFMWQKLDYIHTNPVKAGLVHKVEEYVYSSAADYVFGKQVGKVNVALLNRLQTTYN